MSIKLKNIQLRSLKFQETESFYLFNDAEIDLTSKFHWDSNNVVQIDLHLTNNKDSERKFKICSLQRCKNIYESIPDYVLIHLSTHTDEDESSKIVTKDDIDTIELSVGKEQHFLFKISDLDCQESYNMEFAEGIPQTKDGSIIVSI